MGWGALADRWRETDQDRPQRETRGHAVPVPDDRQFNNGNRRATGRRAAAEQTGLCRMLAPGMIAGRGRTVVVRLSGMAVGVRSFAVQVSRSCNLQSVT